MLRALVVLAAFPLAAAAAEPLLLPPGRSITVVDGRDAAVRVVLTAPANEPLDIAPLLEAADGNVRALAVPPRRRAKGESSKKA
jgi:hypothetical protein